MAFHSNRHASMNRKWYLIALCVIIVVPDCLGLRVIPDQTLATSASGQDPPVALQEDAQNAPSHCHPRNIRLSPTGEDTSVRLTWHTAKRGCSSKVSYKRATWFPQENGFHFPWNCLLFRCKVNGEEVEFNAKASCLQDESDWEQKSILYRHSVVMDRLQPGRVEYKYTIKSDKEKTEYTFASPRKNSPMSELEFITFGDMGAPTARKCPGSAGTIESLIEEVGDVDLVFHDGDISYADGHAEIWDDFMEAIQPISSAVPYVVTVGNHEYDWVPSMADDSIVDASGLHEPYLPEWGNYGSDSHGECGYPFVNRFIMPDSENGVVRSNAPFWYSLKTGSAHFISISSEHNISIGSEQRAWLEAELESTDRSQYPWLIILIHRPLYVAFPHKSNRIVGEHLTEMLEETFIAKKVNVVVSGHVHSYYRSCPALRGVCAEDPKQGIVHITIGSGGKEISDLDEKGEQPSWMMHAQAVHGYGRFKIQDRSRMYFEFVETESGHSRVTDTMLITQ